MTDKPTFTVVESITQDKQHLGTLYDGLDNCIQDHLGRAEKNGVIVTLAEIVGTIEFIKTKYMSEIYEEYEED